MTSLYKKRIISSFDKGAKSYDYFAKLQNHVAQKLIDLLPEKKTPAILEIGCGTGLLTEKLLKKYPAARIDAIDISDEMIKISRKKFIDFDNVNFFVMDSENLNISNYYDLIVSNMMLHWLSEPIKTLEILALKLKRHGNMLHATIGAKCFEEWKNTAKKLDLPNGIIKPPIWPHMLQEEFIKENYESAREFLSFLKKTGASRSYETYKNLSLGDLKKLMKSYDHNYHGAITWHIIYTHTRSN